MERKNKIWPGKITKITVEGFKSLYNKSSIEVRPLTLLAGANSSGKSSIMQPLLLLKQTLEANYDPGALLLDGSNVKFTSSKQLLSKVNDKFTVDHFAIGIQSVDLGGINLIFENIPKSGFGIKEMAFSIGHINFTIRPNMTSDEINNIISSWSKESGNNSVPTPPGRYEFKWGIERSYCFLYITAAHREKNGLDIGPVQLPFPGPLLKQELLNIIHVPGLRGNPERTYKTTSVGPYFPGSFENYVASIVNHWQSSQPNLLKKLGNYLERLGLTWKVEAQRVDDTQVELRIGRLGKSRKGGSKDVVNIADVGFGISQVLPVLVSILVAHPGQLVFIEQPELHLHPKAQVALAKILADSAKRGVRVIAETHSSLLLLAVQTLVAQNKIAPDLVKLHWFERGKDGMTKITSSELDESGAFGDWPVDFDDVSLHAESEYLDAAEAVLFRKKKTK